MKKLLIMLFLALFALPLQGQKYTKALNQKLSPDDLVYMPKSELRLLKNELIATKGTDLKKANENASGIEETNIAPFLDEVSKANLELIVETELSRSDKDSVCTDQELLERFLALLDQKDRIPLYLQVRFLKRCQNPKANIYSLPASKKFYTVAISEPTPMVGPQVHRIVTFRENGNQIDSKLIQGKAEFKDNKIIHESYNSLIEYVYTIDEEGHFDKETPTKIGN